MFHGVIQKITLAPFFETRCSRNYDYPLRLLSSRSANRICNSNRIAVCQCVCFSLCAGKISKETWRTYVYEIFWRVGVKAKHHTVSPQTPSCRL